MLLILLYGKTGLFLTQDERVSLLSYVLLKHGVGLSYTFLFPLGCFLYKVGISNTI
jgi:hypothetical protein